MKMKLCKKGASAGTCCQQRPKQTRGESSSLVKGWRGKPSDGSGVSDIGMYLLFESVPFMKPLNRNGALGLRATAWLLLLHFLIKRKRFIRNEGLFVL